MIVAFFYAEFIKEQKMSDQISQIETELKEIELEAKKLFNQADSKEKLESLRVAFLGKKGKLSLILKAMGALSSEDRPKIGKVANIVRNKIESAVESGREKLAVKAKAAKVSQKIDISLPGKKSKIGSLHPITQASNQILKILEQLGFDKAIGPEVEHDFYNFEALNIPKEHPARDMQDTFYILDDVVLRTHTSPVQIRSMLAIDELPIRIASFGRVYRKDHDVTHSPMFHQVEGLCVAKNVSFADLKGVLQVFIEELFGQDSKMRLRPSFFPFTEPSVEVDMSCFACGGEGVKRESHCPLCKNTGWIEIMGAGMVDPEVLKASKIDPETYTGFAFGIGVERVAMLLYGIKDIRLLFDNDIRFLEQF